MAEKETTKENPLIDKLFSVGAHFGYTRTRRHPSVAPYIFGMKNKVEIFDLEETAKLLEVAKQFVYELGQNKKTLLFVTSKQEAITTVKAAAESLSMPYVAGRWIGGTLTNFSEIKKRLERLESLREQKEKGEWDKRYTKREQLDFEREIEDLDRQFGGIADMKEKPAAMFIIDTKREQIVVREARQLGIPIVGVMNSDGNTKDARCPIVGNDSAQKSIDCFVEEIATAYKEGAENPIEVEKKEEKTEEKAEKGEKEGKIDKKAEKVRT